SWVTRFVRFILVTGLTSIVGNATLMALYVGAIGLPAIAGNVLAVATMSVLNFLVSDRWVFQPVNHAPPPRRRRSSRTSLTVPSHFTTINANHAEHVERKG